MTKTLEKQSRQNADLTRQAKQEISESLQVLEAFNQELMLDYRSDIHVAMIESIVSIIDFLETILEEPQGNLFGFSVN